jgi:ABC-type transport system involved in cytochrome c biogenesis permease subunit
VNVIIASYALIGMAAVTAAMYIVGRLLTKPTQGLWTALLIPTVVIPLPALLPTITVSMVMAAWSPFLVVLGMFAVAWIVRLVWRRAADQAYAAWEGAPLMGAGMVSGGGGGSPASDGGRGGRNEREGLARVLDGSTMLLLQLSFITLWSGIIMGAIWADHSWGRPWGWDPKEVFALNTWIIFLILVHVRLKVRDKQLWTAVLAIYGCSVMLFNWIVVNFFITGLHSYA